MKLAFSSYWIHSAFYTSIRRFSLTIFGFVNFVILIRSLTPDQMGVWALFLAVTSIYEITKSGLVVNAHIRFINQTKDPEEQSNIAASSFLINLGLAILFIIFIIFFAPWLSRWLNAGDQLYIILIWFIPGLLVMAVFSHFEAILQSHLDFKGVFAGHIVRQVLFFGIIGTCTLAGYSFSLMDLAIFQGISLFLGTAVFFIYCRKFLLFRLHATRYWIREILKYGRYIFGSGLMANLFASLDQFMTAKFITSGSVAYYNTASRINSLIDIPSYAASEILFPKVAKASVEEGNARVKYLFERMVSVLIAVIFPASILVIIFPELIITIIAGREYIAAAPILQLYMLTAIMRPMINQASNVLNSTGKQALCFKINAVSLLVNLIINYICLSVFGLYGAAIGTLITCILGTIAWYYVMQREVGFELSNLYKYIINVYKKLFEEYNKQKIKIKKINV